MKYFFKKISIIKMFLLFAAFFGVMQISNSTYALVNGPLTSNNARTICEPPASSCDFSNQGITSIAADAFADYVSVGGLTTITLSNNSISSIAPDAFSGLTELTSLNIAANQLTSVTPGMFNGLTALTTLSLPGNQIISIATNAFNGLSSLTNLYLGFNQITSIENGSFNGLSNLVNLDFSTNQIISIATNAFNGLSDLQTLYLDTNQIASIEVGDFNGLPLLQVLSLGDNQITSLGANIFYGLNSLLSLYLNGNQITSVKPVDFYGLGLTYLNLSHNLITALESSTFPSALVTLNLSYNEISSIKAGDFAGLSTLNILSLAHNKIGSIVISAFSSPTALRNLNLSYNQIPAIPGQAISVGHDITTLNLSYNCNIDGVQPIYYDNGGYGNFTTDIDDLNCANINSATPAGFISNLLAGGYSVWFNSYQGIGSIGFNHAGATNRFLTDVVMPKSNVNGYVGDYYNRINYVVYNSGTDITYNSSPFTEILYAPIMFPTVNVPGMTDAIGLMRFGALTHSVEFDKPIYMVMSTIGKNSGDVVRIYSSDAESIYASTPGRTFEKTGIIVDPNNDGLTYAQFTGMHASRWVLIGGDYTGTFVINNDAVSTITTGVTLNISGAGLTNMRFQNDTTGGTRGSRVSFSTTQAWTLTSATGTKTVYAQFDADGDTNTIEILASDEIEYIPAVATGSFVINNNAASTTSPNVMLTLTGVGVMNMQFSNDGSTRSSRMPYMDLRPWTLSAGTGLKTVYAQFDTDGNTLTFELSSDHNILYDTGSVLTGCIGSSCADITLRIIANESGYCEIGDSVNFGLTGYSASSRMLQSAFPTTSGNTPWFCNDMQGNGTTRNLSIQSSDLLNVFTNNPSHTIAGNNVSVKNPAAAVVLGACTPNAGSSLNARTPIGVDTPILGKIGGVGEVCKIQTSQVDLQINIPAYQAVGQYSGLLIITVPSGI